MVKPKKHLGQHFLTDENIAKKIVDSLLNSETKNILEVGPGMGVLTKYLKNKDKNLFLAEIDSESIIYLSENYGFSQKDFVGDFLKMDFSLWQRDSFSVIGNFPYNISSQILFKIVENKDFIPEMVGMFQKEVALRVAASPRTKDYGILSVLIQAYYQVEYLFSVSENVFNPPPKVKSGVIRLVRNPKEGLLGVEEIFKTIVKMGFNQRRKKLSNALKSFPLSEHFKNHIFMEKRAEELSVEDFIDFANQMASFR